MKKIVLIFLMLFSFSTTYSASILKENVGVVKGVKQGAYTIKYSDGSMEKGTYKNGKKEGKYIWLEEPSEGDFSYIEEGTYVNGVRQGKYVYGNLESPSSYRYTEEGSYKNGKKNGSVTIQSYSTGIVTILKSQEVNGLKQGKYIEIYDEEGATGNTANNYTEIGTFKNGNRTNFTRKYKNGKIKRGYYKVDKVIFSNN